MAAPMTPTIMISSATLQDLASSIDTRPSSPTPSTSSTLSGTSLRKPLSTSSLRAPASTAPLGDDVSSRPASPAPSTASTSTCFSTASSATKTSLGASLRKHLSARSLRTPLRAPRLCDALDMDFCCNGEPSTPTADSIAIPTTSALECTPIAVKSYSVEQCTTVCASPTPEPKPTTPARPALALGDLGLWDNTAPSPPRVVACARIAPARAMRCAAGTCTDAENCAHFPSARPIVRPATGAKRTPVGGWVRRVLAARA